MADEADTSVKCLNSTNSPTHETMLHLSTSLFSPVDALSSLAGTGLVQVLVLLRVPLPHVTRYYVFS